MLTKMTEQKAKPTGITDLHGRMITTDHVLFIQSTCLLGDYEGDTEDWSGDNFWMIDIAYFPKHKKKARVRHGMPAFCLSWAPTIIGNYSENKEAWDMWIGKSGRCPPTDELIDVRPEKILREPFIKKNIESLINDGVKIEYMSVPILRNHMICQNCGCFDFLFLGAMIICQECGWKDESIPVELTK